MQLLNKSKSDTKKPIQMIGVETRQMLSNKSKDEKFHRTAECAYYKAEARGFEPGHEMEDWLAAEAEEEKCVHH